jgi:hypothetical protein
MYGWGGGVCALLRWLSRPSFYDLLSSFLPCSTVLLLLLILLFLVLFTSALSFLLVRLKPVCLPCMILEAGCRPYILE